MVGGSRSTINFCKRLAIFRHSGIEPLPHFKPFDGPMQFRTMKRIRHQGVRHETPKVKRRFARDHADTIVQVAQVIGRAFQTAIKSCSSATVAARRMPRISPPNSSVVISASAPFQPSPRHGHRGDYLHRQRLRLRRTLRPPGSCPRAGRRRRHCHQHQRQLP